MIARGEVALAVYASGQSLIAYQDGTLIGIDPLVATIFLIVISSVLCPILLKMIFKNQRHQPVGKERNPSIHSEAIDY
jgi:Kef-type K+ transport system membrane component KefB